MQRTGGRTHWHADHPAGMNNAQCINSWIPYFDRAAGELFDAGIDVVNCTTKTALQCFPQADIREVL